MRSVRGFAHVRTDLMLVIAGVGIVVAIAVPNVYEYLHRDEVKALVARSLEKAAPLRETVAQYAQRTGRFPVHAGELEPGGAGVPPAGGVESWRPLAAYELASEGDTRAEAKLMRNGIIEVGFYRLRLHGGYPTVTYTPKLESGRVSWKCEMRDLKIAYGPAGCELL